jgi:lipopolysaccharide transport system permease protein
LNLGELWARRELLYFLVWRDVKIRYKQTVLGAGWAILQPLLTMLIFNLFFGRLAKVPSDGVPYPLFCFAALVPWSFFAQGVTQASNSMVGNTHLITKVYFPRLAIPLSSVLAGVVDLAFSLATLFGLMLYFGVTPGVQALWLPLFLVLAVVTALGIGLWLSALNVEFRDVRHAVPFLIQVWMFATPIAYPSSLLPEPWRTVFGLNPLTGVVEGVRWSLLHTGPPPVGLAAVSAATALALLVSGAFMFRRMEKSFADNV